MEQRLSIITLAVKNLEVAASFYKDKFGWNPQPIDSDDIYFFHLNGLLLGLYPLDKTIEDATVTISGGEYHPFTLAYNTRSETEVDEIFTEMKAKGVKIIKEPEKVFWGGYSGYIADPDGNLWEIAYNPFMKMDDRGNVIS